VPGRAGPELDRRRGPGGRSRPGEAETLSIRSAQVKRLARQKDRIARVRDEICTRSPFVPLLSKRHGFDGARPLAMALPSFSCSDAGRSVETRIEI